MTAQSGRFSMVALIGVRADRGSWAVCDGSAFRHHPPKADLGPLIPQSSTVVATTRTGELDGAKEADGG